MRKQLLLLSIGTLFFIHPLLSQRAPGSPLQIRKATGKIALDGILDEQAWKDAQVAKEWFMSFPVDTALAEFQTYGRLTFDDEFLYVSFYCEDDGTPDLVNSLRRDFDKDLNDYVSVVLGSYNDRQNGFFFSITPEGVQREGIVSAGGTNGRSNAFWDNKWYSYTTRYKDHWIVEMAIPFKSFRYKSDLSEWNLCLVRADRKRNTVSSWIRTPIQFSPESFAYSGQLQWMDPMPKTGTNISLIPFIAGRGDQDFQSSDPSLNTGVQAGFDGKIAITPSLNLDVTVNPDFSQVEVDQQVINLTRFEIRLPERRQFFLENSDLLDNAGFPSARPFFSRRVGLIQDSLGLFQPVPILFGARLSGSLNPKWRLNVLNMQTRAVEDQGLPGQNFTAAALQRNFGAQSNFTLSMVNKLNVGVHPGDSARFFHPSIFRDVDGSDTTARLLSLSNQVVTGDLELLSKDNKWYHSSFVSRSFANYGKNGPWAASAFNRYNSRNFGAFLGANFVGEDYYAEAGFVPSQDVYPGQINAFGNVSYTWYPETAWLVSMGPEFRANYTFIPTGLQTDHEYRLSYEFNLANTSSFEVGVTQTYQQLTQAFNPLKGDIAFLEGEEFTWNVVRFSYESDVRKLFNFDISARYGGFYNGRNLNVQGNLRYRFQPYGNISLQVNYNDVVLAEGYGEARLFLIGPRLDLTFTEELFLTTFVQYNSRLDNVNLNTRFQWRYAPASDFFIVYTENYLSTDLSSKNRALVFKLVYWLNI